MVWPKLTVADYPEMLRKLSASFFIIAVACVWFLRAQVKPIDQWLALLDINQVKLFEGFTVPLGTVAIPFGMAVISEAVKLHDKMSSLLGIRSVFDHRWILIPMALCSGSDIRSDRLRRLEGDRQRLMDKVFYRFASSSKDPKIDTHLITQALTAWSWYWLCLEATLILILTAIIFALYDRWMLVAVFLLVLLTLQLLMKAFRAEAARYAQAEVDAIIDDEDRKREVKAVFDAL